MASDDTDHDKAKRATAPTVLARGSDAAPGRNTIDDTASPTTASAASSAPRPLRVMARDEYTWGAEIGRGGMGVVSQAVDRNLGRPVAIKELLATSGSAARRFEREMRITARLQHPGIVPIYEAGRWPSDEPFYAMKMVSGDTLEAAIAARPTLAARLGLLANVLAVAETIAYAHKAGVIHRDLKPANVILGAYGETVVIDWGLAKDLSQPDDDPAVDAHAPTRDSLTIAGSTLGTPAYMAPEQARGGLVDERSDVYALGAMLYHVLAGARPYAGVTTQSLLDHIREHPPPALVELAPDVPAELRAVVTRAMQRDPALRYKSARELADDLRRFEDGQRVGAHTYSLAALIRRWLRRHRTSVIVAVTLLVALAVTGVVAVDRVMNERDHARSQRAAAEELVQFMLGDVQGRLEPLGKLDLLFDVGDKVDHYYRALAQAADVDDLANARRGQALDLLGKIALKRGDLERADRALADAEATARRGDHAGVLATILGDRGDLEYARGHKDRARTANQQSLAIAERLAATDPADPDIQRRLAHALRNMGELEATAGNLDASLHDYQRSLAIEQTVDGTSSDRHARQLLCATHEKIGEVSLQRGELDQTIASYRACLAIARAILDKDPGDSEFMQRAWESEEQIAQVLEQRADNPGALAGYLRGLELAQTAARRDPANRAIQFDVGEILGLISHVELATHGFAAASSHAQLRCTLAEELHRATPGNAEWTRALEACRARLGEIALALAKPDLAAARAAFGAALELTKQLQAADPTNLGALRDLELKYMELGDVAQQAGDPGVESVQYRAALAIAEQLAAKDPHNATWADDLTWAYENLGDADLASGDAREALAQYQMSLAPRLRQAKAEPSNANWKSEIAESYGRIAKADGKLHDAAGQLAALREQLATQLTLPDDPAGAAALAELRLEIAELIAVQPSGRDEARTLLGQVVPALERAAQADPSAHDVAKRLADAKALATRLGH